MSGTDCDFHSCNLLSRKPTSYTEWLAASPRRFNRDGIPLSRRDIYQLPLVGRENLDPRRGFSSHLIFQNDKLRLVAAEAVLPPPQPGTRVTDGAAKAPAPSPKAAEPKTATKSKSQGRFGALLLKFGLLKVTPKAAPDGRAKLFVSTTQQPLGKYLNVQHFLLLLS